MAKCWGSVRLWNSRQKPSGTKDLPYFSIPAKQACQHKPILFATPVFINRAHMCMRMGCKMYPLASSLSAFNLQDEQNQKVSKSQPKDPFKLLTDSIQAAVERSCSTCNSSSVSLPGWTGKKEQLEQIITNRHVNPDEGPDHLQRGAWLLSSALLPLNSGGSRSSWFPDENGLRWTLIIRERTFSRQGQCAVAGQRNGNNILLNVNKLLPFRHAK